MSQNLKRKRDPAAEVLFESLVSPNFDELARRFPDFGRAYQDVLGEQHARGGHFSSFVTQEFSTTLTKALLHVHWNLALTHMPNDRLCPPVPNRFFFVKWMLQHVMPCTRKHFHVSRCLTHTCLDIGTGASAIYPLLLAGELRRTEAEALYQIYATDIDAASVALARENVGSNHFESQIHVLHVSNGTNAQERQQLPHGPLRNSLHCLPVQHRTLDFCMTNPPFFDDAGMLQEPRQGDGRNRTNMSGSEGSFPGGEVAFCLDMFVDGLLLWMNHVRDARLPPPPLWSACMCGKKSTYLQLKAILTQVLGPGHVMAAEFGPGHLTRWFLAWTFEQPKIDSPLAKHGSELTFNVGIADSGHACQDVAERLEVYFSELPDANFTMDKCVGATDAIRIHVCESLGTLTPTMSNEEEQTHQLPPKVQTAIAEMDSHFRQRLAPPEGESLMIITLAMKPLQSTIVSVHVECYAHSARSRLLLDKIRSQLAGEICRTNRRWRRRLKQQHQHSTDEAMVTD
ncbi:hypothetical protein MPSEU_000229400 [Mayamaea pseudoterrestris]|nr:hypothetical protein MPSEU_000229400 [Mayamaea pseudoterrestris]